VDAEIYEQALSAGPDVCRERPSRRRRRRKRRNRTRRKRWRRARAGRGRGSDVLRRMEGRRWLSGSLYWRRFESTEISPEFGGRKTVEKQQAHFGSDQFRNNLSSSPSSTSLPDLISPTTSTA
jgi:hypothetical protein